jgi:hypothetical protein
MYHNVINRVDGARLSFQSSEFAPPASECVSPLGPKGGATLLPVRGIQSNAGTENVILYALNCNPSITFARYIWLLFNDEAA